MGIYNPFGKVFRIFRPLETHWRTARCEEVDCPHYLMGWQTKIDDSAAFGKEQALYVRHKSGRRFLEQRDGTMTTFTFHPEQQCFREHKLPLDQDPYFIVGQNHRGQAIEPERWKEDWNETSYQFSKAKKEG